MTDLISYFKVKTNSSFNSLIFCCSLKLREKQNETNEIKKKQKKRERNIEKIITLFVNVVVLEMVVIVCLNNNFLYFN